MKSALFTFIFAPVGASKKQYAFMVSVTWLNFNQWGFSISDDEITIMYYILLLLLFSHDQEAVKIIHNN